MAQGGSMLDIRKLKVEAERAWRGAEGGGVGPNAAEEPSTSQARIAILEQEVAQLKAQNEKQVRR
jgi:hypothetical protein